MSARLLLMQGKRARKKHGAAKPRFGNSVSPTRHSRGSFCNTHELPRCRRAVYPLEKAAGHSRCWQSRRKAIRRFCGLAIDRALPFPKKHIAGNLRIHAFCHFENLVDSLQVPTRSMYNRTKAKGWDIRYCQLVPAQYHLRRYKRRCEYQRSFLLRHCA